VGQARDLRFFARGIRRLLPAGLLLLCAFSCSDAEGTRSQSALPRAAAGRLDLQQTLERIRREDDLPGLAAAIARSDGSIKAAAVGVRRLGNSDPIQLTDRFHIASCTKSMTATLAAMLVEQGRLRWTSRLTDILPELRSKIRPEYRHVTLEQLLAHAARIPAYTQFGPERLEELKSLEGTPTQQRFAFLTQVLSSEAPNRGTGDEAYSNAGYTVAALILEKATGESWEQLLRTRLFQPLGMEHVGFGWPATRDSPEQPRGHLRRDGRVEPQPLDDSYLLPVALWPAGAVNGSIGNLARYAADHLRGLRGEKALLSSASYQKLHHTLDGKAEGFTLGWGVRSELEWGTVHYGAGSGGTFFTRILIVPQRDVAIVVASNSGEAARATREVLDTLLHRVGAQL